MITLLCIKLYTKGIVKSIKRKIMKNANLYLTMITLSSIIITVINNICLEISKKEKINMKYYVVGSTSCRNIHTEEGDEFSSYEGTSLEEAKKALKNEKQAYEGLHPSDKKRTVVWGRVYDIPDDVDLNDEDSLTNALCECTGYDYI